MAKVASLPSKPIAYPELPTRDRSLTRGKKDKELTTEGVWLGPNKHLYTDLQRYREDDWRRTVLAFECNPGDFHNAYHYVNNHPVFYRFHSPATPAADEVPVQHERNLIDDQGIDQIHVTVVRVAPTTGHIEDDPSLNTTTRVWFEFGPTDWTSLPTGAPTVEHDLDGGAATYERAVIKIAKKIHKRYGNDRVLAEKEFAHWRKQSRKQAERSAKTADKGKRGTAATP